jgi:hypothetical protein
VLLLEDAARELEAKGPAAWETFSTHPERWRYEDTYFYIYSTNGLCLYHGGMPELIGQKLPGLRGAEGRLLLDMAQEAVRNPNNPDGWIHYWWNRPKRLYPEWKSSCNRLVMLPDGETVLLGIGKSELLPERAFIQVVVDSAAALLNETCAAGIDELSDPLSFYHMPDASLFVVTETGEALIAPAFQTKKARNILDYQDDAGHAPLREAFRRLQAADSTWVIVLAKDPNSMNMEKRGLYMKKTRMGDEMVYVGATTLLPEPAWMQ